MKIISKKIKKPNIRKLKQKAMKLWSEVVRRKGACELCHRRKGEINNNGNPVILNAHHIIGRENKNLALEIRNGLCLCAGCHKFSRTGPHRGTIVFAEWLRREHPDNIQYLIQKFYENHFDFTVEYLEAKVKEFTEILKNEVNTSVPVIIQEVKHE